MKSQLSGWLFYFREVGFGKPAMEYKLNFSGKFILSVVEGLHSNEEHELSFYLSVI